MTTDKTKPKPKVVKENKPKVKESKAEAFKRIVEPRVRKVLKALRLVGNCSNRGNYEYNSEQIEKIFIRISESLIDTEKLFTKSKKEQELFVL